MKRAIAALVRITIALSVIFHRLNDPSRNPSTRTPSPIIGHLSATHDQPTGLSFAEESNRWIRRYGCTLIE